MAKLADYYVSAVRYSPDRSRITHVHVHNANDTGLGNASIWTRDQVITKLKQRYTFCTIVKNSVGGWNKGADIHLVGSPPDEYIRTDRNNTKKDNLENLPEF